MSQSNDKSNVVGTLIGESSSREFRLAVTPEAIREQDIIAVESTVKSEDGTNKNIRVWAKVQGIERLNPLFPEEAGHELAFTQTNPFDTVMSMSREMITAVCQVLGYEINDNQDGKLKKLRYPPQPTSRAFKPSSTDLARILVGQLNEKSEQDKVDRGLDIATLSNRTEVDVKIDGHALVNRHLAILAMTGAGKSWTAKRIIEELAKRNYPIIIFDPHGEYPSLKNIPELQNKVNLYRTRFPIFSEDSDTLIQIIESLCGYSIAKTARNHFDLLFNMAKKILNSNTQNRIEIAEWLNLSNPYSIDKNKQNDIQPTLYFFADFVERIVSEGSSENIEFFKKLQDHTNSELFTKTGSSQSDNKNKKLIFDKTTCNHIKGLIGSMRTSAKKIRTQEDVNKQAASGQAQDLPKDRSSLVQYGEINILSLAGYDDNVKATIYSLVAQEIFDSHVQRLSKYPVLLLLEEAHNFVPGQSHGSLAKERSITITKQIAQEGRKFNVGLMLISQRPSRLDETTLAMCNSYIIMRMMNPADQSFVRKVIESLGEEECKMLPDLENGEAILSGQFTSFPILVKMKEPTSKEERDEKNSFDMLEEEHQKRKNKGS